jgi:hypothetical protein
MDRRPTTFADLRHEVGLVLDQAARDLQAAQRPPLEVVGQSRRDRQAATLARAFQIVVHANAQILQLIDAAATVEAEGANGPTVPRPASRVLALDQLLQEARQPGTWSEEVEAETRPADDLVEVRTAYTVGADVIDSPVVDEDDDAPR